MAFGIDITKLTKEQVEIAAKALCDMTTIRELKGITDEEMEAVYSLGFNFYQAGRYDEAEKIFAFLVMYDHLCDKYWMGFGAVMQVKKQYERAVMAYGYASFLDLENPKPQLHAAECFVAMGDKVNAESALAALEEFCPRNTALGNEYRKKAEALAKLVEQL